MPKVLLRLKVAFDKHIGRLPSGLSEAYLKYIERADSEFVPGTTVRRVRLVDIGPKARAVDEADLDRLINELAEIPHKPWLVRDREPTATRRQPTARPRAVTRRPAQVRRAS